MSTTETSTTETSTTETSTTETSTTETSTTETSTTPQINDCKLCIEYNKYCVPCLRKMFPEYPSPNIRIRENIRKKELTVVDYIQKNTTLPWICNRKIKLGTCHRRPDMSLELETHYIILEIDEYQHREYGYKNKDNIRNTELAQDIGRPIIFIRFNPDDYVTDTKKVTSCWRHDKNRVMKLVESKRKEWIERLSILMTEIEYWVDPMNKTEKTIEIKLFYDNYVQFQPKKIS